VKRQQKEVAWYSQPQRAAFPGILGAAVVGVGVTSTGPRGMSGGCSGSDPAPPSRPGRGATHLQPAEGHRALAEPSQTRWSRSPTSLASCTKHPAGRDVTRSQPDLGHQAARRVPSQRYCSVGRRSCPSLPGQCPRGFGPVKPKPLRGGLRPALTAPAPRAISSYARNRERVARHVCCPDHSRFVTRHEPKDRLLTRGFPAWMFGFTLLRL
jgi:hypothetical protein